MGRWPRANDCVSGAYFLLWLRPTVLFLQRSTNTRLSPILIKTTAGLCRCTPRHVSGRRNPTNLPGNAARIRHEPKG
jgi:hypothetical protein